VEQSLERLQDSDFGGPLLAELGRRIIGRPRKSAMNLFFGRGARKG